MASFKDMFSSPGGEVPEEKIPIPPEEDAVLDKVAQKVIKWQMTVPAILFLESVKPLNFIGAQAMVFFEPIIQGIFSIKDYDIFRQAMERRENIENLLQKIEYQDAVEYRRQKIIKKRIKEQRKQWTWYQRWLGIKQPRIEIDPAELEAIEKEVSGKEKKEIDGGDKKEK